jgi:hypothetical protein
MKTRVLTVAAGLLASLVLTAGPLSAVTSTGPYYAMPAWDQKFDCTSSTNCPRFIVLSNWASAAVLDRETGIVWEQSPRTTLLDWRNAHLACNGSNVGGRVGWRVPTLQELASLVDRSVPTLHLPSGHPFSAIVQASYYWSATTAAVDTSAAWVVDFGDNTPCCGPEILPKSFASSVRVWCARGGQGVDPQ